MTNRAVLKGVVVTAAVHGGHGLCRIGGQVCFVPGALPGDTINLRSVTKRHGVLWGEIELLVAASEHRVSAECPVFGVCGGCSWLHFGYPGQGEWKCKIVTDTFRRIARLDITPEWRENPELRTGYRTRAQYHSEGSGWGFFEEGSHKVVPVESCPLCHPKLNDAFDTLRRTRHKGTVELTVNPEGDEVLAWCRAPRAALADAFPGLDWPDQDAPRGRFLFDGAPVVNGTFSQSSLLLNRLLVAAVHELCGAPGSLLDLYCGNGNLSHGIPVTGRFLGIDHNRNATAAAAETSGRDYREGNEAAFTAALSGAAWDTVLLDPPRTGARGVMDTIAGCDAAAVVYVSCDPATLARDAASLREAGWKIERLVAVDLFPNTPHVETVCRFMRG
jgi:23S rRNA (uracil1939-C5)-methyltransferase